MVYDVLIQTFKDGEWFLGFIMWIAFAVIIAGVGVLISYGFLLFPGFLKYRKWR